jgi:hypothetical protein
MGKSKCLARHAPDLMLLDFLLGGCVTDKLNTLAELDTRITATTAHVTARYESGGLQWDVYRATDDGHYAVFTTYGNFSASV